MLDTEFLSQVQEVIAACTRPDVQKAVFSATLPANAEKGRKPWAEVRGYFNTETVFKTTKRLAQQHDHWNAVSIRERAAQLALWAVARWPKRA